MDVQLTRLITVRYVSHIWVLCSCNEMCACACNDCIHIIIIYICRYLKSETFMHAYKDIQCASTRSRISRNTTRQYKTYHESNTTTSIFSEADTFHMLYNFIQACEPSVSLCNEFTEDPSNEQNNPVRVSKGNREIPRDAPMSKRSPIPQCRRQHRVPCGARASEFKERPWATKIPRI